MADIWVNILGDGSKLKGELDKSSKNVTSFSEKIGKVGKIATAAGVAVTAAFTAIVLKTAAVGDQFDKMSLRTGVAVEDLSALAYAADISGSDIGTLEKGLKALTMVMDDASRGMGEGMIAFEELGISVLDTEGKLRSTVDVLKEAATKIAAIEDPTKQAALAMDLFGSRAGTQLLPLLKMGEAGIEDLMAKAKELGIVVSTEAATAAAEFTDRLTDLKGSLAGAGRMIGDTLIPAITPLIEKATEIVVKIKEWAEENSELVEKIFKWAAALGVTLAVLGPILVILPSLITGVTLLSGAFLPFAIGGAVILGIIKLSEYLDKMNKAVYEAQVGLNELSVSEIDAEIELLAQEIKKLEEQIKITSELPLATSAQFGSLIDMQNSVMNLEMKMGLLIERREELTRAEEEGIDVAELRAEIDEETKKLMDELAEKEEEAKKALEEKTKAAEFANAQMKIENDIYALTHNAMEVATRDLDLQKQAYLEAGIVLEDVNKWYELETKRLGELNEKQKENIGIMEEVARVTKTVSDRIYELTHTEMENNIKKLGEQREAYIKLGISIEIVDKWYQMEIARLDELKKKEEEGIDRKQKLADAYKTVIDKIFELTHTPMETMIRKLKEERQAYLDLGMSIELVDELFDLQILKLGEVGDAFTILEQTVRPVITAITGYLETQLAGAISNLLSQTEDFEWSWSKFWEGLKNTLINAVAAMIAKLVILAGFSWLLKLLGVPVSWLSWDKGGGVGYDLGGQVKKFQFGGVADTIPARLTVGEYVIAKPMTDFIKKFKAIPQNLVDAVVRGLPTPAPAFAGGGPVGTSNITSTSFGEIKIYIDIHGNKISDDVDIKRLARTVSEEILRKINLNRRH